MASKSGSYVIMYSLLKPRLERAREVSNRYFELTDKKSVDMLDETELILLGLSLLIDMYSAKIKAFKENGKEEC